METRDDGRRLVGLDDKHERVGKAAKQGPAHVLVDYGELTGSCNHALDYGVDRCAEPSAQARQLLFVPVLRFDQLGSRVG
jgi:hypothetical protein